MGCSPSKEELQCEVRLNGSNEPKTHDSLLGSAKVNGSGIRAKVEAANDLTLSQTRHIHRLGSMTIFENPFDPIEGCTPEDLLLLQSCQVTQEPETPDLRDVQVVVREMLIPGWGHDEEQEEEEEEKKEDERGKRAVYTRQDTYTKSSEGIVNLGFEDHKPTAQKHAASVGTSTQGSTLTTITESTKKSLTTDTTTTITSTTTAATKTHKQKTDTKEDNTSRKTSESEAVAAAVIQGKGSEASESSSNESESEDEGGSVVDGASLLSQLGGGSTYRSDSSIFTAASEASRKKAVPSREMKAALKVLNDSIGKPVRSGQQLTNALNIVQREWLKVSSQKDADPHAVEDYMDAFEDYSKNLLQKVVNLADVNGNTAMHYAVSHGNFDVVSVLLDSKVCNVNQQNKAGYTATMLVSLAQIRSQTHASVVQRLFQLGDLNIKASQHGQTALMLAVSHGRLDMVQMLVAAGAEINIQDDDGSTALMCAAEHGHLAIVKFLLAQPDTDPTLMDNDGSTALTIAVEAGHRDVGVLLYKHLNLSRGSSPYSSVRIKRSRTPNAFRSSVTPPPRSSAPSSPGRSRKSSNPASPGRSRKSSASLSNLIL